MVTQGREPKEGDLVMIRWLDACRSGGWQDREEGKRLSGLMKCEHVGWVLCLTDAAITVHGGRDLDNSMTTNRDTIPRANIIEVQWLNKDEGPGG